MWCRFWPGELKSILKTRVSGGSFCHVTKNLSCCRPWPLIATWPACTRPTATSFIRTWSKETLGCQSASCLANWRKLFESELLLWIRWQYLRECVPSHFWQKRSKRKNSFVKQIHACCNHDKTVINLNPLLQICAWRKKKLVVLFINSNKNTTNGEEYVTLYPSRCHNPIV